MEVVRDLVLGAPERQPMTASSPGVTERCPTSGDAVERFEGCRRYLLTVANEGIGKRLQSKLDASDLVQDTFLEAQRHLDGFRGTTRAEMRAWLRRILECRLSNIRRFYLGTAKRAAGREVAIDRFLRENGKNREALACRSLSPSMHAARAEWTQALEEALERMPEHYRKAVVWRHQEQLSWEEIGRRMNYSAEAARKTGSRAIGQLRRDLQDLGFGSMATPRTIDQRLTIRGSQQPWETSSGRTLSRSRPR